MTDEVKEKIDKVENTLITYAKNNCMSWKSKKFKEFERAFVMGASIALDVLPPSWGVALMSSRDIISEQKFKEHKRQ